MAKNTFDNKRMASGLATLAVLDLLFSLFVSNGSTIKGVLFGSAVVLVVYAYLLNKK